MERLKFHIKNVTFYNFLKELEQENSEVDFDKYVSKLNEIIGNKVLSL